MKPLCTVPVSLSAVCGVASATQVESILVWLSLGVTDGSVVPVAGAGLVYRGNGGPLFGSPSYFLTLCFTPLVPGATCLVTVQSSFALPRCPGKGYTMHLLLCASESPAGVCWLCTHTLEGDLAFLGVIFDQWEMGGLDKHSSPHSSRKTRMKNILREPGLEQ